MSEQQEQIKWYVPLSNDGEVGGLNDSGIQQFKRAQHLARETIQNSIDASDDTSGVATVEFRQFEMDTASFPGYQEFKAIFEACKVRVDGGNAEKEKKFIDAGLAALTSGGSIPVLRIRDTNTVGLEGSDDDRRSRWFRLIRGQGSSSSEGPVGGTYGIGQRAPFAHSSIRVLFYSTMTPDGRRRFMGKYILCGCEHPESGEQTQNIGYYGNQILDTKVESIADPEQIPEFFRRDEPGTDIYIMGFTQPNLKEIVTCAVLTDFYVAILHKRVVIRIFGSAGESDQTVIDHDCLAQVIDHELEMGGHRSELKRELNAAKFGVEALLNGSIHETSIDPIGIVKMYVTRSEDAGNSVHYMRSPRMKVESKRHSQLRDYQAVVLVDDPNGNKYLAALEDPGHSRWEIQEAQELTEEEQRKARSVIRALRKFAQNTLSEIRGTATHETRDIAELSKYLPMEDEDAGPRVRGRNITADHSEEESPRKVVSEKGLAIRVVKKRQVSNIVQIDDGGGPGPEDGVDGQGGGGGGDGDGPGGGPFPGDGDGQTGGGEGEGEGHMLKPSEASFRSWLLESGEKSVYRISVTSGKNTCGSLLLKAVGEQGTEAVRIIKATDVLTDSELTIDRHLIRDLELKQGQSRKIDVEIESEVDLALVMGRQS